MRFATKRMSAWVDSGKLFVDFYDGASKDWSLPDQANKNAIRDVLSAAIAFALANGASDPGQTNAVRNALTEAGNRLTR